MKTFGLLIIFGLASVYGRDVYTSINWDPRNPIFKGDGKNCGPGPRQLKVRLNSQIYLVCPNLATVLHPRGTDVQTSDMWENIWLLKNKTAFDECDVSQLPVSQRIEDLHKCNKPTGLVFLSLLFLEHAAGPKDRTFEEGRTYYVMATSDGTQSSVDDLSGGHCNDTSKNVHMRIEVYICNKTGDRICNSTNVGVLTCPTTAAPHTTSPYTTSPYTTSPHTTTHGTNPGNNTTVPIMTNRSVAPCESAGKEENPTTTTTTMVENKTRENGSEERNSFVGQKKQKQEERIGENHEVVELQNSRFMWMVIAITVSCLAVIVIVIFVVHYCSGRKKKCPLVFPMAKEKPKPGLGVSNSAYVVDTITRESFYEAADQPSSQKLNHITIATTSFN